MPKRKRNGVWLLVDGRFVPVPDSVTTRVRELHREGRSHAEIAAEFPNWFTKSRPDVQARSLLYRLGLKRPLGHAGKAHAKWWNAKLVREAAEFATRYNLPADLRVQQVRILIALASGPLTSEQLNEVVGTRTGIFTPITRRGAESGSTYIGDLRRRSLVVYVERPRTSSARSKGLYLLSPGAMDLMARHDGSRGRQR